MNRSIYAVFVFFYLAVPVRAQISKHVVLISVDGFRPDFYLEKTWPAPNMQSLMKQGVYAKQMKSVFPSYTYPSHTAMLTGALPARSGIHYNQPRGSKGEWNWFTKQIKVPTLWQALKKNGLITSAVEWPLSVDSNINLNIPEIWNVNHPEDRITEVRRYATPGLIEEIEKNATGKLDSNNMSEEYLLLDENAARMASYIFSIYKPSLLALHLACVDGAEHGYGRDGDTVRLAVASADRAIGNVLEAIARSGEKENTTVIIVGDHGFSDYSLVFRPNIIIKDVAAKFTAAGGSAFLYTSSPDVPSIIKSVVRKLDSLPDDKRKLFRILERAELDSMGADSSAILALAALPGMIFSSSLGSAEAAKQGPGTNLHQNSLAGVFTSASGGHHGYDPRMQEMFTVSSQKVQE